ncbi:MAG TPA: hypothetical protein VLY22_00890 [Candidatus Nitrosotalea sp.]|nr:hypothetical protein [Candidatus Nitrosotalea sp.]
MTDGDRSPLTSSQWSVIFLTLAAASGSVIYRLIVWKRLEQTSVLFIGIPAILAVVVALTPKAKTAMGGIMKGITLFLLISGAFLGEGFICIVMASPIFYAVGACVGVLVDWQRRRSASPMRSCLLLLLLPLSLEGISPALSFNRDESVQVTRVVNASAADVQQALASVPRVDVSLPLYLRMGFPRPVRATGSGFEIGALRTIHFAGGEGHPGDLVLRVEESRPGYLRYVAVSDRSKVAHWLAWQESQITWKPVDTQHTVVTWTLRFQRKLDPAWYFGPWERYAARLTAETLIQANATPSAGETGR